MKREKRKCKSCGEKIESGDLYFCEGCQSDVEVLEYCNCGGNDEPCIWFWKDKRTGLGRVRYGVSESVIKELVTSL